MVLGRPYYQRPNTILAATTKNLQLFTLPPAIPFGGYQLAHFLEFFFLNPDLAAAAGGNFLQITALGRFKKADPAGTDKNPALLDFAVKTPEQTFK
jgi:hypothetical protein